MASRARFRKRDWPIRVYKYDIIEAEIPQSLWDQARRMKELWTALCNGHAELRQRIKEEDPADDVREGWWVAWRETTVPQLLRDSGLKQECDREILARFETACTAAFKDVSRGWPEPGRLVVSIPHRFSGGGYTLDQLNPKVQRSAGRFRLSQSVVFPESERRLMTGTFGLNDGSQIPFTVMVHRPIPVGSMVKYVRWVGHFSKAFGWAWSLSITVEEPHREPRKLTGQKAAIDVGWRLREGALRIGFLLDSQGHTEEILLPLDFSTNKSRRQRQRHPEANWNQIPHNHRELAALCHRRDKMLDACKADLEGLFPNLPRGFDKMRGGGLVRLLRDLPEHHPARARLQAWVDADTPLFRMFARAHERFAARRRDLYRNIAARLARTYDTLLVERLDIKDMIEDKDKPHALRAADRYHQIAATADFLQILAVTCKREGVEYKQKDAAKTTATCSTCGAEIEPGQPLELTCANGHTMDQDENAARNLLSHPWPDAEPRKRVSRREAWKKRLENEAAKAAETKE